ncbi:hypothetical protein EOPP23_01680 [Endozoicomonas sp. OPT23]|uniref:hypothetical protein n=1 Tax=Endozoicomonas sp. OPT23 TaxID=2072845 RepID=UPI00129AFD57|nr:hypothetical protein [Endozoicomonas sp. OPT23]MRI31705.1 hypothetical protein [Endozoicomonas sp. OPT23]
MDFQLSRQSLVKNICRNTFTGFFASLVFSLPAQADMTLSRMIVDFQSETLHHQDVTVFNGDQGNLYVTVNVFEILNPGTAQEKRVPVQDMKNIPLVATPKKLIVPGNSQKNVRLVSLEESVSKDRIFRVNFSPALGKLKARTSGIRILAAYDNLVIIRPEKPVIDITTERKSGRIVFQNKGNSNAILQNGYQCHPEKKKQCEKLPNRRLYAGNTWELKTPFSGPVYYEVDDGSGVKNRTFGAADKKLTSR